MPIGSRNALDFRLAGEQERIRRVYELRKERGTPLDPFVLYAWQERQIHILRYFRKLGLSSLKDLRILDVGCGGGASDVHKGFHFRLSGPIL